LDSRERVLRSINCKEVDRVPIDLGGTVVTSMCGRLHKKLRKKFGIQGQETIIDYTMGTVQVVNALTDLLSSDVVRVGMNVIPPTIKNGRYTGCFGIEYQRAYPHEYYEVCSHPLQENKDLDKLILPNPTFPELYHGLRDRAKDLYENSKYALFGDFGIPGFYETGQKLCGYEDFACALIMDEGYIYDLFDRLLDLQKRWFKEYLSHIGGYACVVGYADDLGMQDRLQISPKTYRKMIKPYHKKIFDFIHEQADIKIMLHSCGDISSILEDLIEVGVDIINPVQTRATNMQPSELREKYGGRVAFWGGMDVQLVLPFGTKEEIDKEVRSLMQTMGRSGYVFAPSHNLQADTPVDNVIYMYNAAKQYR
jgi:uroporphyrinogen decarboxylase